MSATRPPAPQRVGRNAGLMGAAKVAGGLVALGAVAVAARALPPEALGLVVLLHALLVFLTEVATFESWLLVVREGSLALAAGDEARLGRTLRFAVALDLAAALAAFAVACVIGVLATRPGAPLASLGAASVVGYLTLVLLRQVSASQGVLRLFDRYDLLALASLTQPVFRLVGGLLAAASGAGVAGFLLAWFAAAAAAALVTFGLALWALRRRGLLRVLKGPISLREPVPGAWRFVGAANVASGLDAATRQLPLLLAGLVGGAAAAGLFKIAQEVSSVLGKASQVADRVVFPALAGFEAVGEPGAARDLTSRFALAFVLVGAVLTLIMLLVGAPVLTLLFGEPYAVAARPAAVLVLAATLSAAAAPFLSADAAKGRVGGPVLARLAEFAAMTGAFWPLTEAFGLTGSAAAVLLGASILCATALRRRASG